MEKQGQHNHILASHDSLRKLDISPQVQEALKKAFEENLSPSEALYSLQKQYLTNGALSEVAFDRSLLPKLSEVY